MDTGTEALKPIKLLNPEKDGGKSVLAALQERKTVRRISREALPLQTISTLLWAAFGVNREEGLFGKPGRTAPSASNSQEIDLYVAMAEGVYLYEAIPHILTPVASGDFRSLASYRGMARAPLSIIYVVDLTRYDTSERQPDPYMADPEVQKSYYYTDTGLIAQNVYLFAASQGLVAWFHNCERKKLIGVLNLRPEQRALFGQSVGYPART
jgi:hypothetical protein